MKRVIILLLFLVFAFQNLSVAQCAMCKAVAESNVKEAENKRARGLNTAILYLLVTPYILGGVGGYVWWRNSRKQADADSVSDNRQ